MNIHHLWRALGVTAVAFALSATQVSTANAQCDCPCDGDEASWTERISPKGQINWSTQKLKVTGAGAPNLNAPNVAVARLNAERAAQMDALRNALETIKGVHVKAGQTVGKSMSKDGGLKSKISGHVKKWKKVDTRYYADGGVEIDIEVEVSGVVLNALVPNVGKKAQALKKKSKPQTGADAPTGIVFDAKGLGLRPALAPRVYDERGNLVFGPSLVAREAAGSGGVTAYVASVKAAKKKRAGKNPVVIKGTKLGKNAKSDLVVSGDAAKQLEKLGSLIVEGKVVFVAD